jgi:DNA-binding CsgD family transcriptional regulator
MRIWTGEARVVEERFLPLAAVQQELALSQSQVIALIASGDLPAIKLLGSWRVERSALEQFICRMYIRTALDLHSVFDEENGVTGGEPGDDIRSADAHPPSEQAAQARHVDLTPQMSRVLELVAWGRSNAEIAEELTVEVSTVKSHVSRLLSRLDCRDRQHLVVFAWSSGLVRREETKLRPE